jgi:hypothetical protein
MQTLDSNQEALSIDTPDGLREFLSYVEDLYDDLTEFKTVTGTTLDGSMHELTKGLRAYVVCKEIVDRCLVKRSVSSLEVEQLQTLYNEMIAAYDYYIESNKTKVLPDQRFTGRLAVGDDAYEFKNVKINVKQRKEDIRQALPTTKVIHSRLQPHTISRKSEQIPPSRLAKPVMSIIARYQVKDIIEQWFGSVSEFEKFLDDEIVKVEAPSKLHSFLKIKHASAFFDLLIDMPVSEVEAFDAQKRDAIKTQLENSNIEYETYVTWVRHLGKMKQMVPGSEALTFGELYCIAELVLIDEHSNTLK